MFEGHNVIVRLKHDSTCCFCGEQIPKGMYVISNLDTQHVSHIDCVVKAMKKSKSTKSERNDDTMIQERRHDNSRYMAIRIVDNEIVEKVTFTKLTKLNEFYYSNKDHENSQIYVINLNTGIISTFVSSIILEAMAGQ